LERGVGASPLLKRRCFYDHFIKKGFIRGD